MILAYLYRNRDGLDLVYNQQIWHLREINDNQSYQKRMLDNLISNIVLWIDTGDYIVLAIDLNKHIINSEEAKRLQDIGLFDAISEKYYSLGLVPTYQRGQVPIDGIFISPSLAITTGGYFSIGYVSSNYRAL